MCRHLNKLRNSLSDIVFGAIPAHAKKTAEKKALTKSQDPKIIKLKTMQLQ